MTLRGARNHRTANSIVEYNGRLYRVLYDPNPYSNYFTLVSEEDGSSIQLPMDESYDRHVRFVGRQRRRRSRRSRRSRRRSRLRSRRRRR